MAIRRALRSSRQPLPDALLSLAASLTETAGAEAALGRLTDGLADRNIGCALLVQPPGSDELRVERATLPLVPDVWGRSLRLPVLASAVASGRPALLDDIDAAFIETTDGGDRPLLSGRVSGSLIVVPLRLAPDRTGALCLAGRLREDDLTAAWGLGLALVPALRAVPPNGHAEAAAEATAAAGDDIALFHDLTRRLSYSLDSDEAVRAGLEALAPALGFELAVAVAHRDGEDATTVLAPKGVRASVAQDTALDALEAFVKLTGSKHRSCERPGLATVELTSKGVRAPEGRLQATLDAPLVIDGEIAGLLRIASSATEAFDAASERLFYTVANQVSLAIERVAAQRDAERAHLASLAESLSDGVVLVDAELSITSINDAAKELIAPAGEGETLEEPTLAELAREALATQRPAAQRDLESASQRRLVASAAPLAGSPEGSAAVVIVRDVTEERLMQERLLQSEKMVSVGQLVSGVAHELNNPLTGITGFAQLLLARDLDDEMKRDVETIYGEAERASKIVQNLLSFARRKRAEKEPADLNVLVERVLELRTYDFRVKNMDLELDLDPDLPKTMVDANQIQQVFLNVVINAEQAMRSANSHGTLRVRSRREGDVIRFTFQDDGPGMSPETLRRIFDPFFTTKETGEGTGLGLTISYGIIDDHGGRIWAESAGRGTTFTIELPVVEGGARPAGPVEAEPEEPAAPGSAILVVDDEESIQRLLGSILEMDGHRVDTAGNGREALDRIARRNYDMVITDIKMPEMDGRELYDRLRREYPGLAERTVFITGDTVSPETRDFLQRVDNPCLAKPFRVRQVRETISAILERNA